MDLAGALRRIHLDGLLLLGLVVISLLGLGILYSAGGQTPELVLRQAVRLGVGFAALLVLAQVPPQTWRRWTPWLYLAGVGLLLAVFYFGRSGGGAQRWLDLGVVNVQPSELMKLVLPMMIAWYLSEATLPPRPTRLLMAVALIVTPALLIARQPDLGTAVLVAGAGFFVLFLAGLSWQILAVLGIAAGGLAPVAWYFMHAYQRQRVLTFLNPESDPLGAGYHIIQSKIAIGSGGLYGKGWLNGTQSQLDFLPERSTDFVFAVFGEEFGLLGTLTLLALYTFVAGRGLYIAVQAQDTYTRLVAGGLSLTFFVYVFVNTGMVTGLLPVVGVPLPLVSYGGTSMVTLMAGFGILMSIHTHRRLLSSG
ncbi:MAG: rod shape-determining protein RodA [Gammaproteobacteria bacterium]|nr:rod shape-determining protein RodA [Gammaproteobacteria bacterium]